MRILVRSLAALVLVGLVATAWSGLARSQNAPVVPHVVMVDSNAPINPPGDALTGVYGYAPVHLSVRQGTSIVFDNPMTNAHPHTVTSITWTGTPPTRTLASGAKFDSSPTSDQYLRPGSSYPLDTTGWDPGQYVYYCTIHPWMVGSITVTAAQ